MDAASLVATPTPMPNADDIRRKRSQDVIDAIATYASRTMIAASVTGGLVALTTLAGDDAGDAARVAGLQITAGDLVLVNAIMGVRRDLEWLVVGRVVPDPPIGYALDAPLTAPQLTTTGAATLGTALTVGGGVRLGGSGVPTIALNTAAGGVGTGRAISIVNGGDYWTEVSLTTGTGVALGTHFTVSFSTTLANSNYAVIVVPTSTTSSPINWSVSNRTTTSYGIAATNSAASTTYTMILIWIGLSS